jgi:dTDP-4-dehydrorhamnose reductase
MKVLITGSNGQLGSEIKDLASDYENLECVFGDLPKLDICDTKALTSCIVDEILMQSLIVRRILR